jgi:hypothetical protein
VQSNAVTATIRRKPETDEWVVVYCVNHKRIEDKCYYTNDRDDAIATHATIVKLIKQKHPGYID